MSRGFLVFALLGLLGGCAKPVDLPDRTVGAANISEFTRFRSDLEAEYSADRLHPFDVAIQELRLNAMNRDIVSPEARDADMVAVVNGKTVQVVTLLGWEARRDRVLHEIGEIDRTLQGDLRTRKNAGADGPSTTLLARIQSAQNVIAQLQRDVAETERRLAEFRTAAAMKK